MSLKTKKFSTKQQAESFVRSHGGTIKKVVEWDYIKQSYIYKYIVSYNSRFR